MIKIYLGVKPSIVAYDVNFKPRCGLGGLGAYGLGGLGVYGLGPVRSRKIIDMHNGLSP